MRPAAEQIAEVVADIRANRTHHPAANDADGVKLSMGLLRRAQEPQPVVDCTAIFRMQLGAESVAMYEDYPQVTPPWENAFLCYVNTFGNVVCLQVNRAEWDGHAPTRAEWFTDNPVDWAAVRWIATTAVWLGGVSGDGRPMQASGPCHIFRHAIRADGSAEDINWVALLAKRGQYKEVREIEDPNGGVWQAAMVTLQASLNFLNASNVDIAEPARPRPERRRIERSGVQVQTIVVRPPGKRRQSTGAVRPLGAGESALSPVRGHFAHYGPTYGKGLLFGKYAGKFYIPSHVRGEGESEPRDYVLKPAGAS